MIQNSKIGETNFLMLGCQGLVDILEKLTFDELIKAIDQYYYFIQSNQLPPAEMLPYKKTLIVMRQRLQIVKMKAKYDAKSQQLHSDETSTRIRTAKTTGKRSKKRSVNQVNGGSIPSDGNGQGTPETTAA